MREENSEAENNSRGIAEVVPVDLIGGSRHTLEKVIHLPEPHAEVVRDIPIESHAGTHRKAIGRSCGPIECGVRVRESEESLREWRELGAPKK